MTQRDTPPQAGLTRNPHETGVVHDVFCWPGQPVWYVTRDELAAIEARARRRGHQAPLDAEELRTKLREQKRFTRGVARGRKFA
ncbi:MAG TPA: hypothetical protein VM450_17735 [Thermomicrobiales bacterium]|nr:hypothetical protein [Thermomicrobiales bacterium]